MGPDRNLTKITSDYIPIQANASPSARQPNAQAFEIGVFDQFDQGNLTLAEAYEDRLKLIDAYERVGLRTYHCAEHHLTPLGNAPSPSLFFAAIAQRTRRLRFGPLVYVLPIYNPLRLAEEICMLDQISRGRLDVGIGRGISPIELGYLGVKMKDAPKIFSESLDIILQAMLNKTINFDGEFYRLKDVPFGLSPFQMPHPPLWCGVANAEGAARAARARMNIVASMPAEKFRGIASEYMAQRRLSGLIGPMPKLGLNRFVVIAENDKEATDIARRAYRKWHDSFMALWVRNGQRPEGNYPNEIDGQISDGRAVVGSPNTVLAALLSQLQESGANYLVCRFAFGDLSLSETLRTLDLFTSGVMPSLQMGTVSF